MSEHITNDARLFEELHRRFGTLWQRRVSVHLDGLTMTEFKGLMFVDKHDQATMSEVANALGLTLGACTNVVDNLVDASYVVRHHDKQDRRIVRITLTPAGREEASKVVASMTNDVARLLGGIGPEERSTFLEAYRKVVESAEAGVPASKLQKVG